MIASFSFPTQIAFGTGALDELPSRIQTMGARKPLIVTDPGILKTDAFQLLRKVIGEVPVFSGVHANPIAEDVDDAAKVFQENGCDSVVAFGGGSALDVGKIVRAAVADPGKSWQQLNWQDTSVALSPLVAIPTTAGTGSEVGRSSVITFAGTKKVIFHPALLARLAILDPRVTQALPPHLTAWTGADAITHCIESFTSPVYHPLCEGIALEGLRIGCRSLPPAVENGGDLEARGQMRLAAMMGGIAFQKDLGATHSLSHPLSARFGLNHGLANALCLPAVMKFNAGRLPGVYRRIAMVLELPDCSDAAVIAFIEDLLNRIGILPGLRNHGVDAAALDDLSHAAFADSCHATNPVQVTREDLKHLYEAAF